MVHIATTGAMIPEAMDAATELHLQGMAVNVLNLTSPRRLFETWHTRRQEPKDRSGSEVAPFDWLIPANERHAPIVTVHDGASHNLAWLGSVYGTPVIALGVDHFGQSGTPADLYRHFGIDADGIVAAAKTALSRCGLF